MAGMSANYYPGRDDYMMPDMNNMIVSPSPQRVMPEVPVQIADSLENLELQAKDGNSRSAAGSRAPNAMQAGGFSDTYAAQPRSYAAGSRPMSDDHSVYNDQHSSYHSSIGDEYLDRFSHIEEPSYSPFPKLQNPGPNIPPTDEEKEVQIEGARMAVLSSNDPEMQLVWAQDALNYVEIAIGHLTRIADPPGRPPTPALEHQIKTDAINVVGFLADQHHPRAEFMRGNWLEFGKFGYRIDKKEAFRCYARAAEKGFSRAEYRMGMQFENSNEPMKAIKHYTQGAAAGDSASNYRLGMMTLLGQHGQTQDYAHGVHLIQLAADTADENAPQGAYVFGMLLARELPGIEVPEPYLPVDIPLAKEMIEKAAFLGFARAQLKMGTAYELCQLGCDFNPALSLHYNALAARQGESEADMAISKWFLCGHEGVFDKNEELAFKYAERAAASGLGTAEFALGYFYEIGMYVPVDLKAAQQWYAKAAAHGNKDASGRIDGISRSKTLSKRDHENVAISKIRARHGSQRKTVNPLTAKRQSVVPPAIQEVDMPEVPGMNYNYASGPPPPQPHRNNTMPPINTDFIRQPGAPQYGPQSAVQPLRPGTAVPYPARPGSSNGLAPGGHAPMRPSSAAGYGPGALGPGMIPPAGTYPAGPPRPTTAMSSMSGPPAGRRPGYGPPGPPPGGRQPYPGAAQGIPPMQSAPPETHYPPPQNRPPPAVDIGFEAPLPRPEPPKSPAPSKASSGGGRRPPSSHGQPHPAHPSHRPVGLPTSPSPAQSQHSIPPPQSAPTPAPAPAASKPAAPKPAAAAAPAKPPGKGPKTFEEMGVPQQAKEQECVIM